MPVRLIFAVAILLTGFAGRASAQTPAPSSGVTPSTSAGIRCALNDRVALAIDGYYAPLTVRRFAGAPQTVDSLVNARALLVYRWRR